MEKIIFGASESFALWKYMDNKILIRFNTYSIAPFVKNFTNMYSQEM